MARSVWKGPYVDPSLLKKVKKARDEKNNKPIVTWSRRSMILPNFVGLVFMVYNGRKHIPVTIREEMIGHKLGEFALTRTIPSHSPHASKRGKK